MPRIMELRKIDGEFWVRDYGMNQRIGPFKTREEADECWRKRLQDQGREPQIGGVRNA